jgi:hypothetical protein
MLNNDKLMAKGNRTLAAIDRCSTKTGHKGEDFVKCL